MSIISAENVIALLALLFAISAFGAWSERTRVGQSISGAMVVIIIATLLGNLGILPRTSPVYDVVWVYLVPVAISLLLFKADLKSVVTEGGRVLLAFLAGALGVTVGGVIASLLLGLQDTELQNASIITASLIGGSLNFVAVAKALGHSDMSNLTALLTIDSLVGVMYFVLLGAFAKWSWFVERFPWPNGNENQLQLNQKQSGAAKKRSTTILDLSGSLALACLVVVVSNVIVKLFGWAGYDILFITIITVAIATFGQKYLGRVEGEQTLAMLVMYLLFALLGAGSDFSAMLDAAPGIFVLLAIVLATHICFMFLAGRFFRLSYAELIIASFACIGGPPIAAAFAILLKWHKLTAPGIVAGILGYVIGTFIGVGFFMVLQT